MELSVVIPCHGGVEDTRACLRALAVQEGAPEMEVLVVDNASADGTAELGDEFDGVRVLPQDRNLGFAGGVNVGLAAARGEWLMVLNNDTMAAPHMVGRLLGALRGDGRIGLVGPVSNFVKGLAQVKVGGLGETGEGREELERVLGDTCSGKLQDIETLAGLCLVFHRRLLEQVGGFDERFGRGNFEDDEFCLRVRLLGHRIVIVRDAFLHHHGTRTFLALGLDYATELRDRKEIFRRRWLGDPAGAALLAWHGGGTQAAAWARQALGVRPAWPDAHLILARDAADFGRPAQAIEHLRSYLTCCPLHTEAATLLAFQTLALGNRREGVSRLVWALENCYLSPEDTASVLLQYGLWCLGEGMDSEAEQALADASALEPENGILHNAWGVVLLQTGQLDAAVSRLERALGLGCLEAHTNLGICRWRMGDPVGSLTHLLEAVRRNPGDPGSVANLDRALEACRAAGIHTEKLTRGVERLTAQA